tara:strand:+ start:303 stop:500 length:198 start_codon:yes stop_codon:yes gene_type:complete
MNIKEARFYAGLSQYDIALKTGIPQSRISLIERGYFNPSDEEKKKISKVLRHKTEDLFSEQRSRK